MNTSWTGGRGAAALCAAVLLAGLLVSAAAAPAAGVDPSVTALPAAGIPEAEPNDTAMRANPLVGNPARHTGTLHPQSDDDWYRFSATAGSRVYATVNTAPSPIGGDSILSVISADGATVLEKDFDDGTFATNSSVIAGTPLPTTGTYYLRVVGGLGTLPYDLYVDIRPGSAVAEIEPNDAATPQAVGSSALIEGSRGDVTDVDAFSVNLEASDTIVAILDLDPERDGTEWNGLLGLEPLAGARMSADDPGTDDIDAEALFATVQDAGSYRVVVTSASGATGTYALDIIRLPHSTTPCRRYENATSFSIPDSGSTTSTISVADSFTIGRTAVMLDVAHNRMSDVIATLTTPGGNVAKVINPFNIPGTTPTSEQFLIDDEAALPPGWTATPTYGQVLRPPLPAKMRWLAGGPATGQWTLRVYDFAPGSSGTVNSWAMVVCERPEPVLPPDVVFSTDFESSDAGFTHHGLNDEWERGTPTLIPIQSCASGTTCWKTDLDGRYEPATGQVLVSPPIDLTNVAAPATLSFAHKYEMEMAVFDSYDVDVREVGGPDTRHLFANTEGPMGMFVSPPSQLILGTIGWETVTVDISQMVGRVVQFRWRVTTDGQNIASGVAVDDVVVRANPGLSCTRLTLRLTEDTAKSKAPTCAGGTPPYSASIGAQAAHGKASAAKRVTYKPRANFYGSDSFATVVTDAAGLTAAMPVRVRVAPVNDAPTFLSGEDQDVIGAAGPQRVAAWADRIIPGPKNEAAQHVSFLTRVVSRTGSIAFSRSPTVTDTGDLRYAVEKGSFGSATIAVRAVDDGPGTAPDVDRSEPQTFTISAHRALQAFTVAAEVSP
jgi:subtilisin-like proprotein convertase family protein